jgi:diguanylate cyclase (GGDEF)-like protein
MQLSKELKKKLKALSDDFSTQLPERLDELERKLNELRGNADTKNMMDFRLNVHKLAGSAATFGFDGLSVRAKQFEVHLEQMIGGGAAPTAVQLKEIEGYIDYLRGGTDSEARLEEVEEVEEIDETFSVHEQAGLVDTERNTAREEEVKQICLYGFNGENRDDIAKHLGFYGYTVVELEDCQKAETWLKDGSHCLLFIDGDAIREEKEIKQLKDRYSQSLSVVVISDDDTFALRLKAIRSGCDAFFTRPLDMGRLIDRIDGILQRGEKTPVHVLIVDDDREQVAYYALILQQAGMITSVASDPKTVLSILVESRPDLILMDLYMPRCSGIELTKILRQHEAFITVPIIFLSFESDKDRQMKALGEGGDDFLLKPINPDYLVSIVTLRARRNRNLRYFMERDSLTGLLNHSNLKEQLAREIMRAERSGTPVSFAMIDADHFKNVNDSYGHLTGDRVLKSLARMLQDRLRRTDIIGRYGGEEFGVILINTTAEDACTIMDEIRENFSRVRHHAEEQGFYVTFSCGISSYPLFEDSDELGNAADEALYKAKEGGRNRVEIFKTGE